MKTKLLTLRELEENVWWWKRDENRTELERIKLFGFEVSARNYELMRRSKDAGEYRQNYLDLDRENKTTTAVAWANPKMLPKRQVFDLRKQEEIGWTSAQPHFQWNLQLSNRVLKKAFQEYIDWQRKHQNISGEFSLKGKKGNRPDSWRYIEHLDMKRNKIKDMGDSERGMASKAEEMAAQYLSEFKIAIIEKSKIAKRWGFYDFSEVFDIEHDKIDAPLIESS
jgi:hypothetical protein